MRGARYAAYLAGVYVVAASGWIIVSSDLAAWLLPSVEALHQAERVKGLGFVLATGLALFFGAQALFKRVETTADRLVQHERTLLANERRIFAGLMASSVAHDANNMLTAMLFDVEVLDDAATSPQALAAGRERLKAAVRRLVDLNARLVKVAQESTASRSVLLDLGTSVREAVELMSKHPSLRQQTLQVSIGEGISLMAQPGLISQIVTNLLVNAGEATVGEGKIDLRVLTEPERVVLEVHDSGPGVPPERRAGLFDSFLTTKRDGNGIGLFSVRACARALGGDVTVGDSDLGGACFRVALPRPVA